jgi:ATP/maltotriose-dependent transcriptional regulator MalT
LLQTPILDELCDPLCDAIMDGGGKSQPVLEYLERSNIFLVALDEVHNWYRYHHLFANLPQARLAQISPEILAGLHRWASQGYEEAGIPETAILHALSANDTEDSLAERSIIPFVLGDGYFATGDLDQAEQLSGGSRRLGRFLGIYGPSPSHCIRSRF